MLHQTQRLLGRTLDRLGSALPLSALSLSKRGRHAHAPPHSKASRAGPLIAYEHLRQPAWTPRDYAAFAREGFMQNAVVYRSVRMIAEAAASVPLLLYEGEHEITEHPLLNLIARPNPVSSAPDLLEAWYGFLLVSGNAYLEAVAVDGTLRELHALRPDRMKVIPAGAQALVDQVAGRITHVVVIRRRSDVTPSMRFRSGPRVLEIQAVLDTRPRNRLRCLCEERYL